VAVAALLVTDVSLTEAEGRRIAGAVLGRVGRQEREPLALMVGAGTAGRGIPLPLHPAAVELGGGR